MLGYECGVHGPRIAGLARVLGPWAIGTVTGLATTAALLDQPWWVAAPAGLVVSSAAFVLLIRATRLGVTERDLEAITEAAPPLLARPLRIIGGLAVTRAPRGR
jgi:hypothetical protein